MDDRDSQTPVADGDQLRRSKRNKFHLDIVGMQYQLPRRAIRKRRASSKTPNDLPKNIQAAKTDADRKSKEEVEVKVSASPAGTKALKSPKMPANPPSKAKKIRKRSPKTVAMEAQRPLSPAFETQALKLNSDQIGQVEQLRAKGVRKRRKRRLPPKPIKVEDVLSDCQDETRSLVSQQASPSAASQTTAQIQTSNEAVQSREDKVLKIVESVIAAGPRPEDRVEKQLSLSSTSSERQDATEGHNGEMINLHLEFKCQKCPSAFDSRTGLANHLKLHGVIKRLSCSDPACDFSCDNLKTMRFHRRFHALYLNQNLTVAGKIPVDKSKKKSAKKIVVKNRVWKANVKDSDQKCLGQNYVTEEKLLHPQSDEYPQDLSLSNKSLNLKPETVKDEVQITEQKVQNVMQVYGAPMKLSPRKRELLFCKECPFQTKNPKRLVAHEVGHRRSSGFRCPICSFRSTSAGFLKRHAEGHGVEKLPWPPVYEGSPRPSYRPAKPPGLKLADSLAPHKSSKTPTENGEVVVPKTLVRNSKGQFAAKLGEGTEDFDENLEITRPQRRCHFCEFICHNRSSLVSHMRRCHKKPTKWDRKHKLWLWCRHCGMVLSDYGRLMVHRLSLHCRKPKSFRRRMHQMMQERRRVISFRRKSVRKSVEGRTKGESKISGNSSRMQACPECPYRTPNKTDMVKHRNNHDANWPNACPHCSFSCKSAANLSQHTQMHARARDRRSEDPPTVNSTESSTSDNGTSCSLELGLRPFGCKFCPYRSRVSSDMRAHEKMHSGERKFKCETCSYSTHRSNALEIHEKLHKKSPSHFDDVQKSADTESSEKKGTEERKEVECANIGKTEKVEKPLAVRDKRGVQIGRLLVNKFGQRTYVCRFCPFKSHHCTEVAQHARFHLGPRRPLKCPLCTFSTSIGRRLDQHRKLHPMVTSLSLSRNRRQGGYHCRNCPFVAQSYPRLWHHMQKHKRKGKFTCDKCTFSTGSPLCMSQHRSVHGVSAAIHVQLSDRTDAQGSTSNSEPPQATRSEIKVAEEKRLPKADSSNALRNNCLLFEEKLANQCPDCPYTSDDDILLKIHVQMHGGVPRPFRCTVCSYSANMAESLFHHLSLHAPNSDTDDNVTSRKLSHGARSHKPLRAISRKRNNSLSEPAFHHGHDVKVLSCNLCSFRTTVTDRLVHHERQHIQLAQQRLMATIKRSASAADWSLDIPKVRRTDRRIDRQFCCSKCIFYCDTAVTLSDHVKLHGSDGTFACSLCDYRAHHQNVVRFHEQRHHTDLPVTLTYSQLAPTNPGQLPALVDPEKTRLECKSGMLTCSLCPFETKQVSSLNEHWKTHAASLSTRDQFLRSLNLLPH